MNSDTPRYPPPGFRMLTNSIPKNLCNSYATERDRCLPCLQRTTRRLNAMSTSRATPQTVIQVSFAIMRSRVCLSNPDPEELSSCPFWNASVTSMQQLTTSGYSFLSSVQ